MKGNDVDAEASFDLYAFREGPFISGCSHKILQLGQAPVAVTQVKRTKAAIGSERPVKKGKGEGAKKGRASTTLVDLIDAGILVPGRNKLTVIYKGTTYLAGLQEDGTITYQGEEFGSASAFSMHVKRFQTPGKQGDDGWKSVTYEGVPLEQFRREFNTGTGLAAKAGAGGGAQGENPQAAATDQWVQCDRCRTWRVVPPEYWPAVEADDREDWLCDYATWDVSKYQPFQASCKPTA